MRILELVQIWKSVGLQHILRVIHLLNFAQVEFFWIKRGKINYIFEEADLRRGFLLQAHELPHSFRGTNSLIFNSSFYFHRAGTPLLAKYELTTKHYQEKLIDEGMAFKGEDVN